MQVIVKKCDINWLEIKNLCRTTVNKKDSEKEPSDKFKQDLLIAEHSPIRHSLITLEIRDVPYYVMGHLVRHSVGVTPYVGTSREDRTGIPREDRKQTDLVTMCIDLNLQSLINISKKRLCFQASKETRELWERVVYEIEKVEPIVASVCVPECFRDGGCPELNSCGLYENLTKDMTQEESKVLSKRYTYYTNRRK